MTSPVPSHSKVAKPDLDLRIERKSWRRIIALTSDSDKATHLLAYGPPGTGKSYDFRAYTDEIVATKNKIMKAAAVAQNLSTPFQPLFREETNCTRQTAAASLLGHWVMGASATGFTWNHGPLGRAIQAGIPFVLNDIHLASDDIFDLLMFACDNGATWSLPNGEVLRHTEGFRMLMSMNGVPAEFLDEPLRDRMLPVPINEPSKEAYDALDPDVQQFCKNGYKDIKPGQTPRYSYRTFEKFCAIRDDLGDILAAALVCEGDQERARGFLEPILIKKQVVSEDDE